MFDVESRELEKDLHYYQSCLEAILQVNLLGAKYFGFWKRLFHRTAPMQRSSVWSTRWTLCRRTRGRWSSLRGRRTSRSWASLWTAPASGPASGTRLCTRPGAALSTCWFLTSRIWRAVSMSLQKSSMLMRFHLPYRWKTRFPHHSKYLGPALRESNLSSDLARPTAPAQGCP